MCTTTGLGRRTRGYGVTLDARSDIRIRVPVLTRGGKVPTTLRRAIAERFFRRLVNSLVGEARGPIQEILRSTKVTGRRLSRVLLMNNSAEIPLITESVRTLLKGGPSRTVSPSFDITRKTTVRTKVVTKRLSKTSTLVVASIYPCALKVRM